MSENSDAVVLIVSEETGKISLAVEGKIYRGYNKDTLTKALEEYLDAGDKNTGIRSRFEYIKNTRSLKNTVDKKNKNKANNDNKE